MSNLRSSDPKVKLRRTLLVIAAIILGILAVYVNGEYNQPGRERYIQIPKAGLPPGKMLKYPLPRRKGGLMWVVQQEGQYIALIGRDPADDCPINWDGAQGVFKSVCKGGGTYEKDGTWISGPSPTGLGHFPISMKEDPDSKQPVIVVDTEQPVAGDPRPATN